MEIAHNLSNNLKAYRTLQNLSQVDFAKELGIAKSTLQDIECGKSPTLETISCISQHLGIPVPVLLSDSLPPTQLGILTYLVRGFDWFARSSPQEQESLLSGLLQVSRSLAQMMDRWGDAP